MAISLPFPAEIDGTVASGSNITANFQALLNGVNAALSGTTPGLPLFSSLAGSAIPALQTRVLTSGYSTIGMGPGAYVYDALVNTAYVATNPRTSYLAADGRGFRIDTAQIVTPQMFGAIGDGVADDTAAETAARLAVLNAGGGILSYPPAAGYKTGTLTREPGILILGAGFPSYGANLEPPGPFRVQTVNANGSLGKIGVSSFVTNGNAAPFTTLGTGDSVAISGVVFTGATGTQPAVAANFQCRFTAATPVQWGCEIDMNNQVGNGALNNPAYGWGLVINTGSTYIADTGIVIQRASGEGTGPGYRRGLFISGAREQGVTVQCMDAATFGSMSPAAPSTISAFVVSKSSETRARWVVTETGAISWGDGVNPTDVTLQRNAVGSLFANGFFVANSFWVGGNQVLGARQTGTVANATDLPTVIALANDLKIKLAAHGAIS